MLFDTTCNAAPPSAGSAGPVGSARSEDLVAEPAEPATGRTSEPLAGPEATAEEIRKYWHRYGDGLCKRISHDRKKRNREDSLPLLSHLIITLHTLRDIANSLYGTRVDGVAVPEIDLKIHLCDVVHATTMGVFTEGGLHVVPRTKTTEARAQYVLYRAAKDAWAMRAAKGQSVAAEPGFVLFVAHDRHVHRPPGQRRAPKGSGRARRGAGIVVSASGSVALVAALDLALEGVGRVVVR